MSPKVITDIFHRRGGLNPPEDTKQTAIGQIQSAPTETTNNYI
jgi:hypothetical protein